MTDNISLRPLSIKDFDFVSKTILTDRQHGKKISPLSDDCLNLYACSCLAPQHKLLLTQMFAIMKMSQPMGKTVSYYNISKEIPLGNKKRKKSNRFIIAAGEPTT